MDTISTALLVWSAWRAIPKDGTEVVAAFHAHRYVDRVTVDAEGRR